MRQLHCHDILLKYFLAIHGRVSQPEVLGFGA